MPRGASLQERIAGRPGSIVFVAADGIAVPFGLSFQLVGDRRFGAEGFRYAGNILVPADDPIFQHDAALCGRASALVAAVAADFGVVGVNGIDFVARHGIPFPIEVNPRYSASMELAERAYGISIFDLHVRALDRDLPSLDLASLRRFPRTWGKAVVYARRDLILGDTSRWLDDEMLRDIPHPGERIGVGQPVCTIFATGRDVAACHSALVRRAAWVYRLAAGGRSAA